jgi:hypothetical protein
MLEVASTKIFSPAIAREPLPFATGDEVEVGFGTLIGGYMFEEGAASLIHVGWSLAFIMLPGGFLGR